MRSNHTALTVAPVPATTDPKLLVAPYLRVLASPTLATVVTSPSLSPRVVPVYTPPLPHLISTEEDDPIPRHHYPLRSLPWFSLSESDPHLIYADTKFSTAAEFTPTSLTGPLFAYATLFLLATEQYHHHESNDIIDEITGISLEYHHIVRGLNKDLWIHAFANNIGRIAQEIGMRMPTGTNTVLFVPKSGIPR